MAKPSRILIVDDEPFNVDYLEQELEDLGYETESAYNGREALEKVTLDPKIRTSQKRVCLTLRKNKRTHTHTHA